MYKLRKKRDNKVSSRKEERERERERRRASVGLRGADSSETTSRRGKTGHRGGGGDSRWSARCRRWGAV